MREVVKSKKGLSAIVVTLIIIVISLVAVGVVWVVVNNLLKSGTGGADIAQKCLNAVVDVTKVNCSNGATTKVCDVQFTRSGTGSDDLGGVKLVFKNATSGATSSLIKLDGNIEELIGKKQTGISTSILNANGVDTMEYTVYFRDASNTEQNCQSTKTFNTFSLF